jgi:hypothetical protein
MSYVRHLIVRAPLVLISIVPLMGQVGTQGSILGTVVDSSRATLPAASITVTNLDTGLVQTTAADDAGNFEILALPIGPYSVTVSMPGFKTWTLKRVVLTVGERSRVSPVLDVGNVT